jgi:hypothetical protein
VTDIRPEITITENKQPPQVILEKRKYSTGITLETGVAKCSLYSIPGTIAH